MQLLVRNNDAVATHETAVGVNVNVKAMQCFCPVRAIEECLGAFVHNSSTFIISRTCPIHELKILQILKELKHDVSGNTPARDCGVCVCA